MLCNPNKCPPSVVIPNQRGDGICNPDCMNPFCNYDTGGLYNISTTAENSDCLSQCYFLNSYCKLSNLGNGVCDGLCNKPICGLEFSDCGYCAQSCNLYIGQKSQLGNECDPKCNTTSCYYDMGACLECAVGCNLTIWGDGTCNDECNNSECNYDNGDCFNVTCAPGCYLWMIGNSICDETCHVKECNYDNFDCDCSPGCNLELLQNNICDEVCNNYECEFDNGKCGFCESGCYLDMLRNDVCDEVCNTYRCKYDYFACRCSLHCSSDDYGKCKPSCLVSDCMYDRVSSDPSKWCYDEDLIKYTVYQQIFADNSNSIVSFDNCSVASSNKCNLTMSLDHAACYPECNSKACNYGLCFSFGIDCGDLSTTTLCSRCTIDGCDIDISKSTYRYFSSLSIGGFQVAYFNYWKSLKHGDFQFYYVTSNQKGPYPSGNGTLIYPFETLDHALQSKLPKYGDLKKSENIFDLWRHQTLFFYLYNDGNYTLTNCDSFWINSSAIIASYDENQILIEINGWSLFSCPLTSYVKFENVIFEGSGHLNGCSSIYCDYCAYSFYDESDGYYYNDRNQRISQSIFTDSCQINNSKSLSLFYAITTLTLINVDIRNFRFNYDSIISGNGTIELFNVNFDNIWLSGKEKNAVVHPYGKFTYKWGSVTRLNNGFEFGDSLDFRGFLYSEFYSTFTIKNVDFKYNLVYLKSQSSLSSGSLIYLNNMTKFEMDNCTFMYNYCETGIFYSELNIGSYDYSLNETYYLTYLTISHISIQNTHFISNYGKSGLIRIEFLGLLLNVQLSNLTFESNGAESNSIIYIYNSAILDYYKTKTIQNLVLKNLRSINVVSVPRWCKFIDISFKTNHAMGMITAINMVNFDLKNLNIHSNGSPYEDANVNSLVLKYFIENRDAWDLYISKEKYDAKAVDCEFIVSLSKLVNLYIEGVNISKNTCRNSSPTFIIDNSNSNSLNSLRCSENVGNGLSPVCFYLTGSYDRNLTNLELIGNRNNYISGGYGALKLESENILYITNCSFVNNSASLSSAVYFSGISISIESSIFDSNESRLGNGGALYFISLFQTNEESSFIINSSYFIRNSAASDGGAIFLIQNSRLSKSIDIKISQSDFIGNYANNGAALYIDNSVVLSKDSIILASNFNKNTSKKSGVIFLYFNSGILSFISCEFIENSSYLAAVFAIDIAEDKQDMRSKIYIDLSIFRKNTGNSVIYTYSQNKNSSIETKNSVFEYNNARVVSLNFDYFVDNGSVFQFNSAPYGSCFYLQNSAILYANSSQFLNNTGQEYGGVIAISSKSIFNCNNCSFIQNKAKIKGGVLDAEQESRFFILNSTFKKNSCEKEGSAIYAFNCNLIASSLILSQFSNNYASNTGVISLISSKILILSSIFSNNSAGGYSPGLSLTFSSAEIYDSKFENQRSNSGNFIYLLAESNALVTNSTFYNGKSNERGGAIYASSSTLLINDSFFNKLSSPSGGAIYASFDSYISINNSRFDDIESPIEGGVINVNQVQLFIENSIFNKFYLTGIYGSQIKKLEIVNSSLSNGSGDYGGALYCDSCKNIEIKSSNFVNNSASSYGGALFLKSTKDISCEVNVTSSEFLNNFARNGGAIYSNNANLNIFFTNFKQNRAISGQDLKNRKIDSGIGGGINMNCFDAKKCEFNINSNNFIENFAEYDGGGISWDNQIPSLFNNKYQNNIAQYGIDIASYPIKLMQVKADSSLADFNSKRLLSDPVSSLNLTEIASGQTIKNQLLIALVDDLNNIITTDNVSEATLKPTELTTQISGKTKVTASKGIFNFSEFVISDEPGSNIQIMVTSPAIDISKIKSSGQSFYSQSLILNVNMRKCKIGEVKSGKKCQICPKGFYSLNPNTISCLSCPDAAECYGNYTMVPRPGYWRDNMHTDKFWKCPHPSSCLGSPNINNISYTGECSKAYKGNKCQSCKAGFSYTSSNKCEKCPEYLNNILMVIGVAIGLLILLTIIIKTTRKSALKPKSQTSIFIKIFLNYFQMIILVSTFKLNWSSEVLSLFNIQNNADYVYQQIYSCQCLFGTNENSNLVYFKIIIMVALIPAIMIVLNLFFWIIIKLIKTSYKSFWDDFVSTCIILLFLVHPSVVRKMFASMNCTEINPGEYWLEDNLDIRCWDYDHIFYVMTISLPTIILWGIILPTVCLVNIIRNKSRLGDLNVRIRYGFLFNGYRDNHYFWEFIILYSKIILICCSVFLARVSLKIQAIIVAILYSIYLRLQYSNNPYTEPNLNQMELRARLVCAVTIWSGLYYLMGSLNDEAGYFFFAIIVAANCYFLIYWLFCILKSISQSIIKKFKSFEKSKKVENYSVENSFKSDNSRLDISHIEVSLASNSLEMNEIQIIDFDKESSNISVNDKEKIQ
ncbi:unnamed protein product [Blepharisma stoltei]|uniref:LNR domain-containing protein n=1 Tax=Blepharisma stoltei TaxID=1481888 RepID=A0AAU9JF64_9CILI|nr:unnamed protein product [Blepharisma stoltei]